jgi:hypothetical protein
MRHFFLSGWQWVREKEIHGRIRGRKRTIETY